MFKIINIANNLPQLAPQIYLRWHLYAFVCYVGCQNLWVGWVRLANRLLKSVQRLCILIRKQSLRHLVHFALSELYLYVSVVRLRARLVCFRCRAGVNLQSVNITFFMMLSVYD